MPSAWNGQESIPAVCFVDLYKQALTELCPDVALPDAQSLQYFDDETGTTNVHSFVLLMKVGAGCAGDAVSLAPAASIMACCCCLYACPLARAACQSSCRMKMTGPEMLKCRFYVMTFIYIIYTI